MEILKRELSELKKTTVKVESNQKIKQAYLPGGYSDHSVYDLQWQSIHMAAAAACRGSTEKGGYGPWSNSVFSRVAGVTCREVCNRTTHHKECDAELSIYGYMHKATKPTDSLGMFYNYGCNSTVGTNYESTIDYKRIVKDNYYISYCCCRKP